MNTLFELGRTLITPGALVVCEEEDAFVGKDDEKTVAVLLFRHAAGDWGDLTPGDMAANALALKSGARILSSYVLKNTGVRVWVISEGVGEDGHRAATTILLPREY